MPIPPPVPTTPLVDLTSAKTQMTLTWTPPAPVVSGGGGMAERHGAVSQMQGVFGAADIAAQMWSAESARQTVDSWGFLFIVRTIPRPWTTPSACTTRSSWAGPGATGQRLDDPREPTERHPDRYRLRLEVGRPVVARLPEAVVATSLRPTRSPGGRVWPRAASSWPNSAGSARIRAYPAIPGAQAGAASVLQIARYHQHRPRCLKIVVSPVRVGTPYAAGPHGLQCPSAARIAQLVEHVHGKDGVRGSSPLPGFAECLGASPAS